jgi:hypothetical protein
VPSPALASSDFQPERIWQRQLEEWNRERLEVSAQPTAAMAADYKDWDEQRWLRREFAEMKEQQERKLGASASPAIDAPAAGTATDAGEAPTQTQRRTGASPRRAPRRAAVSHAAAAAAPEDDEGFFER